MFGSELKALRAHPHFDHAIDRRALALFASRTYVPAPLSIYRGVFKLPPGCLLEVSAEGARNPLDSPAVEDVHSGGIRLRRYWSYREVVRRGLADRIEDEAEALEQLDRVLSAAVSGQSFADVPVGAFLSGGIDSSTIVGLYQKHSAIPVRTFSIGFEQAAFNEAPYAKAVAAHLGTIHHEHYVTAVEARDVIPVLPSTYDEPFADSSQIPTYLVSRFARQQVTVALTGDGGDELFGGYNRHVLAPRMWRQLCRLPGPLRALAGSRLNRLPLQAWSMLAGRRQPHLAGKIEKALAMPSKANSFDDVYRSLLEEWDCAESPVLGGGGTGLPFALDIADDTPDTARAMHADAMSYLPDDILTKVDRASMAVSLETRVPFLDHRVAEVAARIPLSMKVRGGSGKRILRKLLERQVPRELVDRPKAGFAVPVGEWIRGPLREWAEELLEPVALRRDGWFDADMITARWRSHLSGRRDSTAAIWAVLMFQAWLREQHQNHNWLANRARFRDCTAPEDLNGRF